MPNLEKPNILINIILFLRSFFVILFFLAMGKAITFYSSVPISGSVIGLVLLFICLSFRVVPTKIVLPASNLLLKYMMLFFVPAGVGLINHADFFLSNWVVILFSSLVSTIIVLLSVGLGYQRLSR